MAKAVRELGRSKREAREIRELRYADGNPWVLASGPGPGSLPSLSQVLSTGSCAIGIAFQSVVDAFELWLFRDGEESRCLRYGVDPEEDRTWVEVRGRPEPWERDVFWSQEELDLLSQDVDEAEAAELEQAFAERRFVLAGRIPSLGDARTTTWAILQTYGVPGEWPNRVRVVPPWPLRVLRFLW